MLTAALGITAGLLQALGYFLYIFLTLRRELRPNASTWFMFAYGTTLLAVLEFEQNAHWTLLVLPITCAVLAACVACICWARGTLRWPDHRIDQASFITDIALTICYATAWLLRECEVLTTGQTWYATLAFLALSNLTTLSAFTPILRETLEDPGHERAEPWFVWTAAYFILGIATVMEEGFLTSLVLYPLLNAPLHAGMAWLARTKRKQRLCRKPSA